MYVHWSLINLHVASDNASVNVQSNCLHCWYLLIDGMSWAMHICIVTSTHHKIRFKGFYENFPCLSMLLSSGKKFLLMKISPGSWRKWRIWIKPFDRTSSKQEQWSGTCHDGRRIWRMEERKGRRKTQRGRHRHRLGDGWGTIPVFKSWTIQSPIEWEIKSLLEEARLSFSVV